MLGPKAVLKYSELEGAGLPSISEKDCVVSSKSDAIERISEVNQTMRSSPGESISSRSRPFPVTESLVMPGLPQTRRYPSVSPSNAENPNVLTRNPQDRQEKEETGLIVSVRRIFPHPGSSSVHCLLDRETTYCWNCNTLRRSPTHFVGRRSYNDREDATGGEYILASPSMPLLGNGRLSRVESLGSNRANIPGESRGETANECLCAAEVIILTSTFENLAEELRTPSNIDAPIAVSAASLNKTGSMVAFVSLLKYIS